MLHGTDIPTDVFLMPIRVITLRWMMPMCPRNGFGIARIVTGESIIWC
jgi:hypothetical protein